MEVEVVSEGHEGWLVSRALPVWSLEGHVSRPVTVANGRNSICDPRPWDNAVRGHVFGFCWKSEEELLHGLFLRWGGENFFVFLLMTPFSFVMNAWWCQLVCVNSGLRVGNIAWFFVFHVETDCVWEGEEEHLADRSGIMMTYSVIVWAGVLLWRVWRKMMFYFIETQITKMRSCLLLLLLAAPRRVSARMAAWWTTSYISLEGSGRVSNGPHPAVTTDWLHQECSPLRCHSDRPTLLT